MSEIITTKISTTYKLTYGKCVIFAETTGEPGLGRVYVRPGNTALGCTTFTFHGSKPETLFAIGILFKAAADLVVTE